MKKMKRQLILCLILWGLILVIAGELLITGEMDRFLPGKVVRLEREELFTGKKDFEVREEDVLVSKSSDPWLEVSVPRDRYSRVLIDVEYIHKRAGTNLRYSNCKVFYCLSGISTFDNERSNEIRLLRGLNEVALPNMEIDRLRLDLTDEQNVQIKIKSVSVLARTDLHSQKDVLSLVILILTVWLFAIPVAWLFAHYYEPAEKRLTDLVNRKPKSVLALLMFLSLLVCFWKYLVGKEYFVFLDMGSDAICVYQPFFLSFADDLKTGRIAEWTLNSGLGTSTLEQLSWCMDPFVWPTMLTYLASGFHMAQVSLAWMQALKCFLCAWVCYDFLNEFKTGNSAKIITAYAYGFCGFLVLWGQHYRFSTCFFITTLGFLFLERALKENRISKMHILFALSVAWLAAIGYYFTYMSLIVMTIYTIIRIFAICRVRDVKTWFGKGMRIAGMMVLGIILSGFIFIPRVVEIVTVSNRIQQSSSLSKYLRFWSKNNALTIVCRYLSNNLQGVKKYHGAWNYYEAEQFFFSSFQLLFFGIFVFSARKEGIKTFVCRFAAVALLVLLPFIRLTGVVFNGFVAQIGRYTYVFMPFYAMIIAQTLDVIFKKRVSVLQLLSAGVLYCCVLVIAAKAPGIKTKYLILITAEFIVLLVLLAFYIRSGKYGQLMKLLVTAVLVLNIGTDTWITNNERISLSNHYVHQELADSTEAVKEIYNYLTATDQELYRVEKSYTNYTWYNDAMVEDYYGISYYNSTENGGVQEFFKNCWDEVIFNSRSTYIQFERNLGNSGMAGLLGVKYIISDVKISNAPAYQYLDFIGGKYIYLNTDYNGFGRFYTGVVSSNEFLSYGEDRRDGILENNLILDFHSNPEKAEGKVYFENPQKEDFLTGTVAADSDGFVFVPIAYENGWRATVNEKPVEILRVDYGFMAVPVGAGESVVTLSYDIPCLRQGMIISGVGLAIISAIMIFIRKGRKKYDLV